MGDAGKWAKRAGGFVLGGPIGLGIASQEDPPPGVRQVTKQEYDAAIADWSKQNPIDATDPFSRSRKFGSQSDYDKALQGFKDTMSVLPPPAPDLADETVQRARQAARRRLLMGGLTGPLDLSGGGTARLPGLGGT
jgi:hypothetical protein